MTVVGGILERKYQAAEEFKKRLLKSLLGDKVAKIILFGSLLKGEAKEDSDIDLLVIATDHIREVEKICSEISFDLILEMQEGVEALVYCLDQVRYPISYFLHHNCQTGKEIYKMKEENLKRSESEGYLTLAKHYLGVAQQIFDWKEWRVCVDVVYNSAELAAKGLLILKLDDLPTSHRGIVNKFGELYVKTGEVGLEMGRSFNEGLKLRNKARYEPHATIEQKDAEVMKELAKGLLELLDRKL